MPPEQRADLVCVARIVEQEEYPSLGQHAPISPLQCLEFVGDTVGCRCQGA
jgi:hypothetical protein